MLSLVDGHVILTRDPLTLPGNLPRHCNSPLTIRISFAVSINKQQGQTLAMIGLQLDDPYFVHRQLIQGLLQNGQSQPALSSGTQPQNAPA